MSYINPDDNIESERIPPIPEVARHFIRLHDKQDVSERDIQSLLDRFPVFFRQLLAVINSDHFNQTTKVKSIGQAIELAGFERVCNLMLCLVVYKTFNGFRCVLITFFMMPRICATW